MGDMTDYALDEIMDMEDSRFEYRRGSMGIQDAYDLGIIDELGREIGPSCGKREPLEKTCRCCGTKGLKWGQLNGKWYLFDGNQLHMCPIAPLNILEENS